MAQSLAVFRLTRPLMQSHSSRHVAHQLFRAATAVAANYRSACLGRSTQEFVAKLGVVREEADEVIFWLEFGQKSSLIGGPEAADVLAEARELTAIVSAAYRTTRARIAAKRSGVAVILLAVSFLWLS